METIRIKFDEVSNISYGGAKGIQGTYFDFKSGDLEVQRAYVVGTPIVESGIEVTAAVHRKGKWNLIVGWINHTTGETSIQWSGHQLILGFICLIGTSVIWYAVFSSPLKSNVNFQQGFLAQSLLNYLTFVAIAIGTVICVKSFGKAYLWKLAERRLCISWRKNRETNPQIS